MVKKVSRETKLTKKLPKIRLFLDVSSSNTGVVIFNEKTKKVSLDSINLKELKKPQQMELVDFQKIKIGLIKEYFDKLKQRYIIESVYLEGIFIQPKFLKSSEILLKLHGFLMGYFIDTPQYFLSPSSIKKEITGKGNAKKEEVRMKLEEIYGDIFKNDDISDAFALFICFNGIKEYIIKEESYVEL